MIIKDSTYAIKLLSTWSIMGKILLASFQSGTPRLIINKEVRNVVPHIAVVIEVVHGRLQ